MRWVDKVTNKEVLNLVKEKKRLYNSRRYSRGTQKERGTKITVC